MNFTEDSTGYIGREAVGYLVNSKLSETNQAQVQAIHDKLITEFGDDVWCPPPETLHITLMDWLAPLVDYGRDKDELFEEIYPMYNQVLEECLSGLGRIAVNFNAIGVSPGAVFSIGDDGGRMNEVRQHFLSKINLLEGTKPPPSIVHFSIARFRSRISLAEVENVVNTCSLDITETIKSFRLIRETKLPMQQYKILREYPL